MAIHTTYNWAAPVTTAVCTGQTTGGSGAFTIDGTLLDAYTLQMSPLKTRKAVFGNGIQRTVSLTSTGNISGVNFTIVGVDLYGNAVSETRAGPNNNTVFTTAVYAEVTSVTVNGAVGTATSLGSGTTGNTRWFTPNRWANPTTISLYLEIGGTISVSVEDTPININRDLVLPTAAQVFAHSTLASKTSSANGNYAFAPGAIRMSVGSSTNGTCNFTIVQAG